MTDTVSQITLPILDPQQGSRIKPTENGDHDPRLRALAEEFEAGFLAEMLKHTGIAKMPEAFNGGAGEAGFSDFLTREYAAEISRSRSIGLADQIYRSLLERSQP